MGLAASIYTANPIWFTLAVGAGSVLFPTALPSGPKMTDNQTTTASVGLAVPLVYGTADVSGTVMWLAPSVQTSNNSSKGGPTQQTFQYNQSIAICLCAGPIGGVSRIWENGTIVYDIRPQQAANADLGLLAETDAEYASRLLQSATYAQTFTLYFGDELQVADPTIEAIQGFGQVPGFRGIAYIVYPNRLLQTAQGWRHPTFRFEVFTGAPGAHGAPVPPSALPALQLNFNGTNGSTTIKDSSLNNFVMTAGGTAALSTSNPKFGSAALALTQSSIANGVSTPVTPGGPLDLSTFTGDFTIQSWINIQSLGGGWLIAMITPNYITLTGAVQGWYINISNPDATHLAIQAALAHANGTGESCFVPAGLTGLPGEFLVDGAYHHVAWVRKGTNMGLFLDGEAGPVKALSGLFTIPVDERPLGSPYDVPPMTIGGTDNPAMGFGPAGMIGSMEITRLALYTPGVSFTPPGPFVGTVSVGAIIEDVCTRSGLTTIDKSDLDAVTIAGYSISTMTNGSGILAPLRTVAFFDAVDSGSVMRFVTRGKPVVATLTTDDIGAYDGATASVPPPSVTIVRAQEEDMPRSIRFHYKAVQRDYEVGEQDSPFRLATKAVNDVDISSPICLLDDQAAQCAEVNWADAWAARTTYSLAVDQSWLELECADCIAVPVDNVLQRMRIATDKTAAGVLRSFSCVRDDGGAYISIAVATPPQRPAQVLTLLAPTTFELLDLPALSDVDNDPGFYIAAQRQDAVGRWTGCIAYQSIDGGGSYAALPLVLATEAALGLIAGPLPISQAFTWDDTTVITVNVPNSSVGFESRTDAAVLAGANAAAIGDAGRWEIVQFATATQVTATQWTLSRLLRGRRGTEHVIGSSVANDRLVMLSTGDLARIILPQTMIGVGLNYAVVSRGATFASGLTAAFTGNAEALKPFSPVAIDGAYVGADIVITWIRRGRLGRMLASGTEIPLSEATEAYQVDIYSGASPPVFLRTLSVGAPTATYTAAEQHTDQGASPFVAPTMLFVEIYQLSAIVGRGTPGVAALVL